MLELQNISYQVDEEGKDKEIIKDISLKIDGRFTAITGPNGGGKSTLAKIIAGIRVRSCLTAKILQNCQLLTGQEKESVLHSSSR